MILQSFWKNSLRKMFWTEMDDVGNIGFFLVYFTTLSQQLDYTASVRGY
jgi:hypothetical protein